jgi:hypothetical protein
VCRAFDGRCINGCQYRAARVASSAKGHSPKRWIKAIAAAGAFSFAPLMK